MKTKAAVIAALAWAMADPLRAAGDRFMAPLPPDSAVETRLDVAYARSARGPLSFDLYRPAAAAADVPVVVFVNGVGAPWLRRHVQYTGWARAVTGRGLAGVTMDSSESTVAEDVRALLSHLQAHAKELRIDAARVALWSCSANVKAGLPLVMELGEEVRSGVVYYGTADVPAFRLDRPVLFVRAGLDNPPLNRGLDTLVAEGLRANAPIELLNLPAAVHAFDLRDDTELTRAAIRRTLDFLQETLAIGAGEALSDGAGLASAAAAAFREDWPAAAAAYETLVARRADDPLLWQRLGEARRARGDREGALVAYDKALALGSPSPGIVGFAVATLHAESGDVDAAIRALQGLRARLRFFLPEVRTSPAFAAVRADPRFETLARGIVPPPQQ